MARTPGHRPLMLMLAAIFAVSTAHGVDYVETPSLVDQVAAGELPPVAERLPLDPAVVTFDRPDMFPGEHGGELRILMGKSKDIRMMMVYGYARLVGYNQALELEPDLLRDIEVEDSRIFTLHLREGHKWSDGHPFTSEDFRYYWEDIANDSELSPFGPPKLLLVKGDPPTVEILDEVTVRYTWARPNPNFLPALAGARPLFIYRPAHYLKQFHGKYTPVESIQAIIDRTGTRNWAGLHHRMDHPYKSDNPDLPVLQPWKDITPPPADRFLFERNPFYHRVDINGLQLPYIDRVVVNIADNKLVPAKAGAGDTDLQGRYLRFDNYTFLKASEERNDYQVRLWRTARGSQIALYPNLNVTDPVWRELVRDVRFRRALSLAIDRVEINEVVYYGLAHEAANMVLPESPLFREEYRDAWAQFDLAEANRLLDEIGLTERNKRGLRLLPDGRPMELVIETAGESTEETDVLELIHDSWVKIGVKPFAKPSQREVFRNRIFSGDAVMSIWSGLDNGIPTPEMVPVEFAPTSQVHLQWPQWGQNYETGGEAGEPPDLPEAQRLMSLYVAWEQAESAEQREAIWHEMLSIFADQVYTIGVVSGVRQPVVVSNDLHNVPVEGIYSWDPGAYFGIYHPDTFWLGPERR